MAYWLFKCDPERYRIDARLHLAEPRTSWAVTRYGEEMAPGDLAFIFRTGKNRGLVALMAIDTHAIEAEELAHDMDFWKSPPPATKSRQVFGRFVRRFAGVPAERLRAVPELAEFPIFRGFHQATNYRVEAPAGDALVELLDRWVWAPSEPPPELDSVAIYTIVRSQKLAEAMKCDRSLTIEENKRWVSGEDHWREATKANRRTAILFAAAEAVSGLTHWGLIDSIKSSPPGAEKPKTQVRVSNLQKIRPARPLSELALHSSGHRLSDNYIRPYAIVRLPEFVG